MREIKWVVCVEGGPFERSVFSEYDSYEEALEDYKAESTSPLKGYPYKVTLCEIKKQKGDLR